ncbi:hypothetical protein ACH5RR_012841 [Cinchona calisaya]|uniref:Uncharacterized protein n=1 Tax=Cinchona calisaya TaxID=153742 RepID=A0ABD3A8R2_9GENT
MDGQFLLASYTIEKLIQWTAVLLLIAEKKNALYTKKSAESIPTKSSSWAEKFNCDRKLHSSPAIVANKSMQEPLGSIARQTLSKYATTELELMQ